MGPPKMQADEVPTRPSTSSAQSSVAVGVRWMA